MIKLTSPTWPSYMLCFLSCGGYMSRHIGNDHENPVEYPACRVRIVLCGVGWQEVKMQYKLYYHIRELDRVTKTCQTWQYWGIPIWAGVLYATYIQYLQLDNQQAGHVKYTYMSAKWAGTVNRHHQHTWRPIVFYPASAMSIIIYVYVKRAK